MSDHYALDLDAFESADQVDEYVSTMRSRRMLSLKYAYIGRAAHTHDLLVRSEQYHVSDTESSVFGQHLLSELLPAMWSQGSLNVLDIGSGNGLKAIKLLGALHQHVNDLHYVGLDYSNELLEIAAKNISGALPWLTNASRFVVDFENRDFLDVTERVRLSPDHPNVLFFVGHTLGNPYDRLRTLANVRDSMERQDKLLLGVELYRADRIEAVLANYRNEPFRRAVFNPLTFMDIKREDGELEISFNIFRRSVEVHFRFLRPITVLVGQDDPLHFSEGERLLIFMSHRFEVAELEDLFSLGGLQPLVPVIGETQDYAMFVLERANIS